MGEVECRWLNRERSRAATPPQTPRLHRAWQLKEALRGLYQLPADRAAEHLRHWIGPAQQMALAGLLQRSGTLSSPSLGGYATTERHSQCDPPRPVELSARSHQRRHPSDPRPAPTATPTSTPPTHPPRRLDRPARHRQAPAVPPTGIHRPQPTATPQHLPPTHVTGRQRTDPSRPRRPGLMPSGDPPRFTQSSAEVGARVLHRGRLTRERQIRAVRIQRGVELTH